MDLKGRSISPAHYTGTVEAAPGRPSLGSRLVLRAGSADRVGLAAQFGFGVVAGGACRLGDGPPLKV